MHFTDRVSAGKLLAKALKTYRGKDVVVYALPRGGVVTGLEIAKYLHAPLELIIARKIGHPYQSEYAIAATSENGDVVGSKEKIESVDTVWFEQEIKKQRKEAKRRREVYLAGRDTIAIKGKTAILVDDGIATGLTMRAGIQELKHRHPKKIVVAVPIIPESTADILKKEVDEVVALAIPSDDIFLGAVGAYYDDFSQVSDEEVIAILQSYDVVDPTLFSFPSYEYMAEGLKKIPNLSIGTFTLERFPNDELHITLHTHVVERECIILGSLAPPEHDVFSFLLLCHTLQKENAQKITALLPYLSYSRHDKKEPQKSYATALIGKLLSSAGVDRVVTVDVHSPHVKQLFPIPLFSLSPARVFAEELKRLALSDVTIVAPDEGAIQRAKAIAKEAEIEKDIAYITKKRTADGVKLVAFHGDVGKTVVIVDDILDTGKTLLTACRKLKEKGVENIYIMVTHGQFSKSAWETLWAFNVKRIYCTDTIPLPSHIENKNITILSITPLLIEELKQEHKGVFTIDTSHRYSFYDYDEP